MPDDATTPKRAEPGDLGRRVATRRRDLDLTRDQLARRAGVTPGYIDYIEGRPAVVSAGVLLRLADALETTPELLLGEGAGRPPGRGEAGASPRLEVLPDGECLRLLHAGGVGRVVLVDQRGPVALPVNYAVLDGDVVFRTEESSPLASLDGRLVGFEVDRIDDAMRQGWSVLVTGRPRVVADPEELAAVSNLLLDPWAGGQRDVVLRIAVAEISGRRIVTA